MLLLFLLLFTEEVKDQVSPVPLSDGLITLSTLPKSHWANLIHLDAIKVQKKEGEQEEGGWEGERGEGGRMRD